MTARDLADPSSSTALQASSPEFFAYDPGFTGGVYIASGDLDGNGHADIVCGADAGGGPHVTAFSGANGSLMTTFFAYDQRFAGGVRVAAGDVNGDGLGEIICGAGAGGGPHVTVFSSASRVLIASFFAFNPAFTGGIYVAAADVNGDGKAEVIAGAGAGGRPHVTVFGLDGTESHLLLGFFAYDAVFTGGVRVGAVKLSDRSVRLLTAPGPVSLPEVRSFDGTTGAQLDAFFAYEPLFGAGLYVAGAGT